MFGDYLDPLGDDFHLVHVDLRCQGLSDKTPSETWTLERMATDLRELAEAMGFERYATLGHSYGAFVVLQHAVDRAGEPAATIVSSGAAVRALPRGGEDNLAAFEPVELREQVTASWAREAEAQTQEDCDALLHDQLPFHFADPRDPRIAEFERRTAGASRARPAAPLRGRRLRRRSRSRTGSATSPTRCSCSPAATTAPASSRAARRSRLASPAPSLRCSRRAATSSFAEENEAYLSAVRRFLQSVP